MYHRIHCLFRLVVCFCLVFSVFNIFSQVTPLNFRSYGSKEGFHSEKVMEIEQDSMGRMWMATNEGLVQYDGRQFKTFQNRPDGKLLGGKIIHIHKDKKGDLWLVTLSGLVKYEMGTGRFVEMPTKGNRRKYINSLTEDSLGNIWTVGGGGVHVIAKEGSAEYLVSSKAAENSIVLCRNSRRVWLITYNYIYQYDALTRAVLDSIRYTNDRNWFNNIPTTGTIDDSGTLWIGKYNGEVFRFEPNAKKVTLFDMKKITGYPSSLVNHIYLQDKDHLWVVVDEAGIWRYDVLSNSFLPYIAPSITKEALPTYKITTLFVDREQNIWLGTNKYGLYVTNRTLNAFQKLDLAKFCKNQIASAILQDSRSDFWVGTDGGGVLLFDKEWNFKKAFSYQQGKNTSLSNDAVLSVFEDSKKRIWIGTFRGGLSLYNREKQTFKHYVHQNGDENSLSRNDIRKITEDKEGTIWLAVHGEGATSFRPETETFHNYTALANPWTYDLLIDKEGAVWTSSVSGISRKGKGEEAFQVYASRPSSQEPLINDFGCLYEDYAGQLWIGSVHGLYQFSAKTNTVVPYKTHTLLDKVAIKSILQDKQGIFFVSTNRGLFKYDLSSHHVQHFNLESGLNSEVFNLNSQFKSKTGEIYFGNSSGISWVHPDEIKSPDTLRKPIITDVMVMGTSFLPSSASQALFSKGVSLEYASNQITIEFACPSFIRGTTGLQFQYKLVGLETDWQRCGVEGRASYPSLPPGTYLFSVRTVDEDSQNLNSSETTFQIVVFPPFWETWWFRAFVLMVLAATVYAYNLYRVWKLKESNRLLQEGIRERTAEILQKNALLQEQYSKLEVANKAKDKLFSIIGHDLRSPFSVVLALGELLLKSYSPDRPSKEKEIAGHIVKASKNAYQLLENLLQWARTQTGRIVLQTSPLEMKGFLQMILDSLAFQASDKKITLEYSLDRNLVAIVDRDMLETMIRNLLHNAIKFTQPNGHISVRLKTEEQGFSIYLKDNGVGMSEEQVQRILNQGKGKSTFGTQGEKGTGLGLLVCSEFLEFHLGRWEIHSELGKGTEFVLHLPCEYELLSEEEGSIGKYLPMSKGAERPDTLTSNAHYFLDQKEQDLIRGKKVLVVDDIEEVRKSVVYQINGIFTCLEAHNGVDAFAMAKDSMPDLIISDVIMPEMDGLELAKKLKQDLSTSHIPILLLTSQKEELDVITGLQTGVDDYLLKPFVPNVLFLKISKLLVNRENLKKKFSLDDANLEAIAENSYDQMLLKKIMKIIDENLAEEEFGVEALSKQIGMHRSNLSRKITSITGSSPQDLIKTRRMKQAAKLLLASGKNVSEVGYEVGFSDPKYFSRSFKSYFGVLPTDYMAINKD